MKKKTTSARVETADNVSENEDNDAAEDDVPQDVQESIDFMVHASASSQKDEIIAKSIETFQFRRNHCLGNEFLVRFPRFRDIPELVRYFHSYRTSTCDFQYLIVFSVSRFR